MNFWRIVWLIGLLAHGTVLAAPIRHSQQFTVIDARPVTALSPGPLKTKSGQGLIKLDADALLMSAERVRLILLSELGLSYNTGGRIRLILYPASKPDNLIGVTSTISPTGWDYGVEIPDQIEGQQLVRGIVHSLLLETANRGQDSRSAELPLWLVEGLTAHLISLGSDLVVSSIPIGTMLRTLTERRGVDYLRSAREVLRTTPSLGFHELASPRAESLNGERLKTYQASAQLFVYELLHTRTGAAGLVRMLRDLPKCWNWETAFLRAFSAEFPRMLDVEKKWSVDVLAFTARDASQVWSSVLCLDRLEDVLAVHAQVRVGSDRLPQRTTLSLREVLMKWEFASQTPVIRQKLSLLEVLRANSSPELVPLIDSYHRTLAVYLQKRSLAGHAPDNRMQGTVNATLVAQDAIRELDLLDKRREALRPERALTVHSPTSR